MRNVIAKQLKVIAYRTFDKNFEQLKPGQKRKYYRYLKKRYNQTPRAERYQFFTQFKRA